MNKYSGGEIASIDGGGKSGKAKAFTVNSIRLPCDRGWNFPRDVHVYDTLPCNASDEILPQSWSILRTITGFRRIPLTSALAPVFRSRT